MVKASVKIKQTTLSVDIDTHLLDEYFDFLLLPEDHRIGFAEQPCVSPTCLKSRGVHMHIRVTKPKTAHRNNVPIWRRVNIVDNPRSRGNTQNVRVINNITFDIDWRPDPDIALEVALIFRQKMSDVLAIHPDLPIILSGRGVHLVINIEGIDIDEDTAELYNSALASVVKKKFEPLFQFAKSIVEVQTMVDLTEMKLEGYDIARLMSAPGDINPHTEELRTVYQNAPLIRRNSDPMRSYIREEYMLRQKDIFWNDRFTEDLTFEDEVLYHEVFHTYRYEGDILKAVDAALEWKLDKKREEDTMPYKSDGSIDYSRLFGSLTWYIANMCRSSRAAYHFRHIIHSKCNFKYGDSEDRLEFEIGRVLKKWEGPLETSFEERKEIVKKTRIVKPKAPESDEMFLLRFVNKMCTRDSESSIEKESFIQKYNLFCARQKRVPLSDQKVTRQLTQIGVISTKKKSQGVYTRMYSGIKLKYS